MKNSLKKYIAVFCAVLTFAFAAGTGFLSVGALAAGTVPEQATQQTTDGTGNVTPPSDNTQKNSSGADGSSTGSGAGSGGSQSGSRTSSGGDTGSSGGKETGSSGGGSSSESGLITVTFNLSGGTGMKTAAKLGKGTSVSQLKMPTKTGYRFTGWSQGGVILPDSKALESDTVLTANWKKDSGGNTGSDGTASVDTHQNQVDAAASEAKAATSDPGILSSEDWNSILSASSAQSGVSSAAVSSGPVSSAAAASGGFSTLLAAGIALILLGVAGVIAFIYLQFIRKPPRGGPRGGSGGRHHDAEDDTLTFTDISSYSNGKKPDDASAVLYPQTPPRTQRQGGRQSAPDRQAPPRASVRQPVSERQSAPDRQSASDRQAHEARMQKSHADVVPNGKGNFDWEKFFDSEERQ